MSVRGNLATSSGTFTRPLALIHMGQNVLRGSVVCVGAVLVASIANVLGVPEALGTEVVGEGVTEPQPFQGWIDQAQVRAPQGAIDLQMAPCPLAPARSCAIVGTHRIYLNPNRQDRVSFLHEIGHVFDHEMPEWKRGWFMGIMGIEGRGWRSPPNSPNEQFAEAWALCARHKRIRDVFLGAYEYTVEPEQHRHVCRLIDKEDP